MFFFSSDYTETTMGANTEKPTPQPGRKLEIILPIVIVCLCIILLCVIVVVLLRRRQKMRDAVDNGHALSHKGSITMRDRLRAESLKSLDSRLLGLYDPKKLRQYNLDHVQYVKDLGEGFFGKVFQGTLYLIKILQVYFILWLSVTLCACLPHTICYDFVWLRSK